VTKEPVINHRQCRQGGSSKTLGRNKENVIKDIPTT